MVSDVKKHLWNELFPNEPMIEPHDGAVEEYAGCLAKHLPADFNTPCPIIKTCENKDSEFWKCLHLKGGGCYEYYSEIRSSSGTVIRKTPVLTNGTSVNVSSEGNTHDE